MKIAFGMTTAPRLDPMGRPVSYVGDALASLDAAGVPAETIRLFPDSEKVLGPYRNFKRAVRVLLEDEPEAEFVCVFQDDILATDRLGDILESNAAAEPWETEGVGVLSLYCAESHHFGRSGWHKLALSPDDSREDRPLETEHLRRCLAERGKFFPLSRLDQITEIRCVRAYEQWLVFACLIPGKPGLGQPAECKWFWLWLDEKGRPLEPSETKPWNFAYGACALLMPRDSAAKIVSGCRHPESKNKTDLHVAETCARLGLSWWFHSPSFIEHVGEVSSLHDHPINGFRRAGKLAGRLVGIGEGRFQTADEAGEGNAMQVEGAD